MRQKPQALHSSALLSEFEADPRPDTILRLIQTIRRTGWRIIDDAATEGP